ncbi:MAG: hypothetical protein M3305_08650 [Actinomycetota bacterium]|nr:hypothetical protein [Actinomycetota bacterium]
MRRLILAPTAPALVVAGMMVVTVASAFAGPQAQHTNFGACASYEARTYPPGPDKGQDQSLARFYNPAGANQQCPVHGGY